MHVDGFLSRLNCVKKTGDSKWISKCPSHDDKTPSLSIKLTSDKKILLHCFSGCSPAEIISAIGLRLHDLFDSDEIPRNSPTGPSKEAVEWSQIVTMLADYDRRQGYGHSPEDDQVIVKATDILNKIPTPQKPTGKRRLAPFSKPLAERQQYENIPFLAVICCGVNCWERVNTWNESKNDIIGMVMPHSWPGLYIWPVANCNVIVERAIGPSNKLIVDLCKILLRSGANTIAVRTLGVGIERIYYGGSHENIAA